jgi:hypothetical protein
MRLANLSAIMDVVFYHKNTVRQWLTSSVRRIKQGSCSISRLNVVLILFHVFLVNGFKLNTSLLSELV